MKQIEISKKAGVSPATVCGILSGKRRPSWDVAKRLAKATKTRPELWLDGDTDRIKEAISK